MENISLQLPDLVKLAIEGYIVYCVQRSNSTNRETSETNREIFKRLRILEMNCAANHHRTVKEEPE